MAVVWGTVKDHNGYIDILSKEDFGTTFMLYFPITRQALTDKTEHKSISSYMGNGETILIVDDVELQREVATDILLELGYKVVAVSSGESAVSYIKNNSIDMVLTDLKPLNK